MTRTLRLFPSDREAREAFSDSFRRPDNVVAMFHSRVAWKHRDGSETYFRSHQDINPLRGLEWTAIFYDEAGDIDGETVARLEAMKRPAPSKDNGA